MSANPPALRTIPVATDGSVAAAYPFPSMPAANTSQLYQTDAEAVLADAAAGQISRSRAG